MATWNAEMAANRKAERDSYLQQAKDAGFNYTNPDDKGLGENKSIKAHTASIMANLAKKKEDPVNIPTGGTTEADNSWVEDYYNSLMDRLNSWQNKANESLNRAYDEAGNKLDSGWNRIFRGLKKYTQRNGQDQYVTNLWNAKKEADDAKADLAQKKLEDEASLASSNYSNYSNILSNIANSSASNAYKKKLFGSI